MASALFDTGEEFIMDYVFEESSVKPASVTVGLYNDSVDSLVDSSDVGDITTEPTGSAYARQTITFGTDWTNSKQDGAWQSVMANVVFDTSDSTQTVDSYFVVINFESDDKGDTGATDHLFFASQLDQSYDLTGLDEFQGSGGGVSLD